MTAFHYEGRTDALQENRQRVLYDLTRSDLKLEPPADLQGPARNQWLKAELYRLKTELKDHDQFADHLPPHGVDGPFPEKKRIPPNEL